MPFRHGQVEALRVIGQVVGHFIFGGKFVAAGGKAEAWKSGIPRGIEEA